ncbi:MAG: CPBP family intramembrane metalloprotease [Bacteroidetes bacterium]|nr:CPBP family intramembrane metalloprotease [Bacteroidota bacterium]
MENFPLWADHILAFIFGITLPVFAAYNRPKSSAGAGFSSTEKKQVYVSVSFSLFLMAAIIIVVWLLFSRPLTALGFIRPGPLQSWGWVVALFMALYIADTISVIGSETRLEKARREWLKTIPFTPTRRQEFPLYLVMCFSAGVFEEIIFRGFLINYCLGLFAGWGHTELWAVLIPGVAFSMGHYYQGGRALIKILILSFLFGFLFIRSGSLLTVMLLHFLVDAAGGLLTLKYMSEQKKTPLDE